MRRLVVRGVMGGLLWVSGGWSSLLRVGSGDWVFLWRSREGGLPVACVGGGIDINWLVLAAVCCVLGLVSRGGLGGGGVGVALLVVGGAGVGVVLAWGSGRSCGWCGYCVCAPCGPCGSWLVVVLWCGWEAAAWAAGLGLLSVCYGWLLVDGARLYGVWVGGLLVLVGRSY